MRMLGVRDTNPKGGTMVNEETNAAGGATEWQAGNGLVWGS